MELLDDPTAFLARWGLLALFLLTLLENLNLPLPSEPILLWAGYHASTGEAGLMVVIAVALGGTLFGAMGSYVIGRWGRRVVDKHGRWVGASPHRVEATERWMRRHGDRAVLYGRVVPLVRTFISIAAGMAHLRPGRFVALTAIGAGTWITLLAVIGYQLGDAWHVAEHYLGPITIGILGVVMLAGVVLAVRAWRRPGPSTSTSAPLS